MLNSLVSC